MEDSKPRYSKRLVSLQWKYQCNWSLCEWVSYCDRALGRNVIYGGIYWRKPHYLICKLKEYSVFHRQLNWNLYQSVCLSTGLLFFSFSTCNHSSHLQKRMQRLTRFAILLILYRLIKLTHGTVQILLFKLYIQICVRIVKVLCLDS